MNGLDPSRLPGPSAAVQAEHALALFARPVVAGATKTRLRPALGAVGAAALYDAFLRDSVAAVRNQCGLTCTLWVAGDPEHPSLAWCPRPRQRQPEGADLGERIAVALEHGLSRAPCAFALGTDTPTLPAAHLARARAALADHDVVLGPAADGGYYLIGARRPASGPLPDLFGGVRWSSVHTLADTLALTARAGLRVALAPPWYDVDEPADLALLRLHLSLDPSAAPATARALSRLF